LGYYARFRCQHYDAEPPIRLILARQVLRGTSIIFWHVIGNASEWQMAERSSRIFIVSILNVGVSGWKR
jgi:hypothetical protein